MFTGDQAAARGSFRRHKPLQWLYFGVVVKSEEEWKRKPLGNGLAHAMRGCHVSAVGEDFHHVADIDDEGTWQGRRIDPLSFAVQDLESRRGSMQERKTL